MSVASTRFVLRALLAAAGLAAVTALWVRSGSAWWVAALTVAVASCIAAWRYKRPGHVLPQTPSSDDPPGPESNVRRLGPYCVERELQRGAMGAVYLAREAATGRLAALKTLALGREFEGEDIEEARQRFLREAHTAARLQHPDIVTVFGAGKTRDVAWIAMEYVAGHDLNHYTRASTLLPPRVAVRICARVARALAYAHAQGIVHRDIKPANVLVNLATDQVKITDFGIARVADASRTRSGMVLGTPSYMAPEHLAGGNVDGRSDVYSLGVMLFELLTGHLPFEAASLRDLMVSIASEPAPDARSLRPGLPAALADVVALALEKRPEVRYADARQLADDLAAVEAMMSPDVNSSPAIPAADPRSPPIQGTIPGDR